ncbi:MAG: sugar phosphate isomerase/epimerase [Verrucomicrobia bacterium]|nr:sugar phosphate isomerase/epimerase [Verrucomicrobiota bacterium]
MKPFDIGLMIWANEAETKINTIRSLGLSVGQVGVLGHDINSPAKRRALAKQLLGSGIEWVTLFAAFDGENYADIASVRNTVGLVPLALRAARLEITKKLSDFGCEVGIKRFAFHVGCVPENPDDPAYMPIARMLRVLAEHCRFNGQQLCFETGQENADSLLRLIADTRESNVKVNFDPANMILYGSGDPIEALGKLAPHVVTVHCKDGRSPAAPGKLGTEVPLGQGEVGFERFIAKLREIGYTGPLCIEREISGDRQIADVRQGIELLRRIVAAPVAAAPSPAPATPPPAVPVAAPPAPEPVVVSAETTAAPIEAPTAPAEPPAAPPEPPVPPTA